MKIAFTAEQGIPSGKLDPRFGRAKFFLVYDTEKKTWGTFPNEQNYEAVQGAGIQAAQQVHKTGAAALVTGNVGPKAYKVLKSAGITVFQGKDCTVDDARQNYELNQLTELSESNVEGHW